MYIDILLEMSLTEKCKPFCRNSDIECSMITSAGKNYMKHSTTPHQSRISIVYYKFIIIFKYWYYLNMIVRFSGKTPIMSLSGHQKGTLLSRSSCLLVFAQRCGTLLEIVMKLTTTGNQ